MVEALIVLAFVWGLVNGALFGLMTGHALGKREMARKIMRLFEKYGVVP